MKQRIRVIITIITAVSLFFNVFLPIAKNWSHFTEKFNPKLYEKQYNQSQYVIPQSKTPISDEELLSHAGYQYINGLNPILINSDHPPFGKYLIGLFTIIFNNNRAVSLVFGFGNILILFILVKYLTKSYLLATLGLLFLSLDTMLIDQIIHSPILDIIQVFFLQLYFLLFFVWQNSRKNYLIIFLGITLGLFCSIKLYFPGLLLLGITGLFLLLTKNTIIQIIKFMSILLAIAFLVYTSTYLVFFLKGNNFREFLGMQKWIFLFWQNNSINRSELFANAIPLILVNQWKVWWGNQEYISYENWSFFWPVFLLSGIVLSTSFIFRLIKYANKTISNAGLLLSLWCVAYLAYACFIPFSPRYLMLLFFPLYIIITLFIKIRFSKYV